ncbi:ephrin type-B receptor 5-like protein [Labeo rohita]|uniref:Ephrin type-B receptor 5-like protein n=2 Tax=Labeo rohita TaxID=84645 RepID=A0A498N5W1_LABRO|nr:ephrin type-B receptor 5-like protein [Labeo rohita]
MRAVRVQSCRLQEEKGAASAVMLLDTTESTAELGWTTYPDTGWDEVSVLDDKGRLMRTFEVCNVNQSPRLQDNWLATPFLYRQSAPRIFVTLRFSVRDCASLRSPSPTCRETLTLYYKQADSQRELQRTWVAEPSSGETREGWVKIDTIAADKSFSRVEPSLPHQYKSENARRINIKTRSFAPLTRKGFVLAIVDSGACVSLMGVSIFYRRCPATSRFLAFYPATPSGAEPTSLVPVTGTCVPHSQSQSGTAPRMHCNTEGEWLVPVGGCTCDAGYEPNHNGSACLACSVGSYKPVAGSVSCTECPANSRTSSEGSKLCECRSGYYRAPTDANTTACTSAPSAPVSLSWEYESSEGGVSLRWRHPADMGGRSEVWYGVVCRICPSATNTPPSMCSWCGDTVTFSPSQTGLKQTRVTLKNLLTRVTYLIQVQAINEVSALSPFPPQFASINFTTSQSVPSEVPMLHQLNRVHDSITLSWPQPDRPNGDILEYQLRYYDKGSDEDSAMSVFSETNTVTVGGLIPGSIYAFQIRARNERGYGPYSHTIYFSTLAIEEQSKQIQNRLPLMIGSIMGGAAFLLVVIAIIIVFVFRSKRRESPYSDRLQRYISNRGGVKYYVDPSTYEDPSEAVKEFAREIDPAHLKIEEVIGAAQFGEVSRGRYRPLGRREVLVAVKTLRWGVTDREKNVFLSEAGVLGQFDHPNVLKLEGVITRSPPERIITEFMENGPLDAFLRGSKIPVRWTAPEAFQHRKFSSASDVWSFGILMWEVMSYGERPYWDMSNQEVMKAVVDQYRLPAPNGCPPALHSLMLQCWQADRQDRPGFDSLLSSLDRLIRHPASLKAEHSRPTQPLLSPTPTDLSAVTTVGDWLTALKMERYKDAFERAQYHSLERVSMLTMEDVQALGVNLLGHQRKIVNAAKQLRTHLTQGHVEGKTLWFCADLGLNGPVLPFSGGEQTLVDRTLGPGPQNLTLPRFNKGTKMMGHDRLWTTDQSRNSIESFWSETPPETMSPAISRTAASEINHWWSQLKFRLQHRKGWNEMLDETFLTQNKKVHDIPLFSATKENNAACIKKLLDCSSTNIFERGELGETALHVAAMNDNLDAALALMDGAPELINEPMTSELYQGLTALHIAAVNQNVNLVQELIKRGGDVATPRVTGMYFRKRRGGLLYFGEHILAFASCVGNDEIISLLLKAGANVRAQDSLGNTVLHLLVLQPNKTTACQVFDLLMSHDADLDPAIPLDMVPNYRGLTPFKLAAKEGNLVVFQHLVNRRRIIQWSLGPLSSNLYDLTEVDSREDDLSVLEIIVSSQKREARRILELTPVRQLVRLKWNLYGKHYFRILMLVYLLYISIFTLCCINRPLQDIPENFTKADNDRTIKLQKSFTESYRTYKDHLRLIGEIISVIGAIVILLIEIPSILRVGAKRYFGQSALGGPFHVTLISYASLVVILCVLRTTGMAEELVPISWALILGWSNVMYFARGFETLGPYVIVIQKTIFGDMTKFMWLSLIFLIGCSSAVWMYYMTQESLAVPQYRSFPITVFTQFELSIGLIDLPVDHTLYTHPVVHCVHICFSVVSYILLFNLLIAMMSDTQWRVTQERDELWRTQVVATTLMLERRLPLRLWPRLGICGLAFGLGERWYLRVEDRNDPLVQKMRRYITAFSKDGEPPKEKAETGKPDPGNNQPEANLDVKSRPRIQRRPIKCWQLIRQSIASEKEENVDSEDIKYI